MVLCLGPKNAGKTLLLKKLQNFETVDVTSSSVPTTGINIFKIYSPTDPNKFLMVRELGGSMASLWKKYYPGTTKILYVVDTSNLCQISAAGILLYSLLVDPELQHTKILLALTKMDVSYRQMKNEALLMLQFVKLKEKIKQHISVVEASPINGEGIEEIQSWMFK